MIEYKKGNLLLAEERYLAHGANCIAVMGAGVALALRQKWPPVYLEYRKRFDRQGLSLGEIQFVDVGEKIICNCMTQFATGPGRQVDYEAVYKCFELMHRFIPKEEALATPKIGCGLAGGNWGVVSAIIEAAMSDRKVVVYEI